MLRCAFLGLSVLALTACGGPDPVAEDAVEPPPGAVGDAPGHNASDMEAADRAAAPLATSGMDWTVTADEARYGPPGAPPALTIRCDSANGSLIVRRNHPAPVGGRATLSLTGGGHVGSLPMIAVTAGGEAGDSHWQGSASGDLARAFARPFRRPGPVEISLGGTPNLVVPAKTDLHSLLARCA